MLDALTAQIIAIAEGAAADRVALSARQDTVRSEIAEQSKMCAAASHAHMSAASKRSAQTHAMLGALGDNLRGVAAQTERLEEVVEQQREMVKDSHRRADDGVALSATIADTLARLMAQNNDIMSRALGAPAVRTQITVENELEDESLLAGGDPAPSTPGRHSTEVRRSRSVSCVSQEVRSCSPTGPDRG